MGLLGGGGDNGAKAAAKAQEKAAKIATEEERRQYNLNRFDFGPERFYGAGALRQLGAEFGVPDLGPLGYDPTTGAVGLAGYPPPSILSTGTSAAPSTPGNLGPGYSGLGAAWGQQAATADQLKTDPNANYRTVPGQAAMGAIRSGWTGSPGYKFGLQQGLDAINSSAASNGLLHSGATLKALSDYGQGAFSRDYYGNYIGGLQSLAGVGQSATGNLAALGNQSAGRIADYQLQAGNARASSYGGGGGGGFGGAVGGALAGAKLGSFAGPWGSAIGGGLGFLGGLFG